MRCYRQCLSLFMKRTGTLDSISAIVRKIKKDEMLMKEK